MPEIQLREGERIDDLQVAGYRIIQHPGRFRFGTDAVLLQNFARLPARARAVDLGTGTGILPILLCARDPAVRFEAVELQPACADMASRSVALNHLEDRIRVHTMDLKDAPDRLGHSAFDAVLCNPPYGKRGGALRNPRDELAIARHEIATDLAAVVRSAAALLRNGGGPAARDRPAAARGRRAAQACAAGAHLARAARAPGALRGRALCGGGVHRPAAAPAAGRAGPALAGAAAHLPGRAHGLSGRRRARVWLTAPAFWCIFFKEN